MSNRSIVALHARRSLLLAELAAQRAHIEEVLVADEATRASPIGDFPRSVVMRALLSRPALITGILTIAAKFLGSRVIARFPNLFTGVQLLRSLLAAREAMH